MAAKVPGQPKKTGSAVPKPVVPPPFGKPTKPVKPKK